MINLYLITYLILCKKSTYLKWTYGHNYPDDTRFTLFLTMLGIIIPSLKSTGQFLDWMYRLLGQNYRVATFSKLYLTVSGIIIPSLKIKGQFYQS